MASVHLVGTVGSAPPPAAMWVKPPMQPVVHPNPISMESLAKVSGPEAERGVCRYFLVGQCRYGKACWLQHPDGVSVPASQPVHTPPVSDRKKVVCRYFLLGNCKFGDQCHYKHENTTDPPPTTQS